MAARCCRRFPSLRRLLLFRMLASQHMCNVHVCRTVGPSRLAAGRIAAAAAQTARLHSLHGAGVGRHRAVSRSSANVGAARRRLPRAVARRAALAGDGQRVRLAVVLVGRRCGAGDRVRAAARRLAAPT
jgi:hypothetical protein